MKLYSDACGAQVGCVLLPEQPKKTTKPVGYWSCPLTSAERVYNRALLECFKIVCAVLSVRLYLKCARLEIHTDHDSFKWVLNLSDVSGRLHDGAFYYPNSTLLSFVEVL